MIPTAPADSRRTRAARTAATARWAGHPPDTVRLDSLRPEAAHLVRALIAAAREARIAAEQATTPAAEIPQD